MIYDVQFEKSIQIITHHDVANSSNMSLPLLHGYHRVFTKLLLTFHYCALYIYEFWVDSKPSYILTHTHCYSHWSQTGLNQVGKSACIVLAKERHSKGGRASFSAWNQTETKLKPKAENPLYLMFQTFLEKNYPTPWTKYWGWVHVRHEWSSLSDCHKLASDQIVFAKNHHEIAEKRQNQM